ncbi:ribosomal protein L10 [Tritrichomonas foetus]|uniref:60S acidic ribosomal protein P0 n=1 Tax=Tritrichomonas foetus TaxID=1144522 RepID=A0A1J4JQC6_9EUKA|nr:ribosomal protein L10 [Tritrichomonas foetus]|eukprot:OHT01321.1 ribosomal protein L10 [Tritrichomonas foetus]
MTCSNIPKKKINFCNKLRDMFAKYDKIVLVSSENVNATQMLHIRHDLNGIAEIVFGKNSLMRRVVNELQKDYPSVAALDEYLNNGTGLIFTNNSFSKIKEIIDLHCVGSPAKVGAISPVDVIIPPMRTTLPPTQVSVLHSLGIQSKIFKGTIEITSQKELIKTGEKVGASEANLLSLLNILPFKYKLKVVKLYDKGTMHDPVILNINNEVLSSTFLAALTNVSSLSLGIGYCNKVSAHHMVGNAFKEVASVAVAIDYRIKQLLDIQNILNDPEALSRLQKERGSMSQNNNESSLKEEEKQEEEEMDLGGFNDLFD